MDPPRSKRLKCQGSNRVPVVMLYRLPDHKFSALRPPTPHQLYSEAESPSSSDVDVTWEPEGNSSDSDFLPASNVLKRADKPKHADKPKDAESQKTEKTTNTTATTTTAKSTAASQPSTTNSSNNKASTPANNSPMIVSSVFSYGSEETKTNRPNLPEVEVKLDMEVLARKRPMRWLRGKVIEIVEKDGRFRYKVNFDEKGRSLVSGHHLAVPTTPKLKELYVGARVVVQSQDDKLHFQPAILAELPSRKNRLRFLVFLDDHTPMYVGLPVLHLICKPLENSLDDLQDGPHKDFLKQYMKNWPYPHLTQYKVGQCIKAEVEETMQKCEIVAVDSSLMQVVFQESQQKEWIHRGSMRLEHMAKFLALRKQQENSEKSNQK